MKYQRVTNGSPTEIAGRSTAQKGNAVAGVKARNGAASEATGRTAKRKDKASGSALASALVVIVDRGGFVHGVFAGRTATRAFLQGGRA